MFTEEQKNATLSMPHQSFLFDQLLRVVERDGQVQLSLSWEQPSGQLAQPITMVITKALAKKIADELGKISKK